MGKIKQPNIDEQKVLDGVIEDIPEYASIRGHKYKVKCLKGGTRRRITEVVLKDGNDDMQSCMCSALIILNGYWAIKMKYWFLWRWFYYVKQYGEEELTEILALGKKKVPLDEYFANTILLTGLKDTSMMMKKTEVATILAAQNTEQPLKSQKNTAG